MRQKIIIVMLIPILWLGFMGCGKDNGNGTGPSPTTYGSIYVESIPTGASVFLDGSNTGEVTPTTLTDIETGNHTIKLVKEDYLDWTQTVYVYMDETTEIEATLSQFALNIYWLIAEFERLDSAWVPKDSVIQLKARDQNGNPVSGVSWHTSDPTIVSVSSDGVVTGLKDWFDNGNTQPEATVYATKDGLTSNVMVVQTVVNLTGEWERESDGWICNVWTEATENGWVVHNLSPISCCFSMFGDSLIRNIPDPPPSQAQGRILENGRKIECTIWYGETDTTGSILIYIKNSP